MIIAVIGKPRQGKTLFITMMGYFDMLAKRKIFSNYALSYDFTPYQVDDLLSIASMKMDISPKTLLMQEAGKWFDSRRSMSPENVDLINFTGQSGKREINVYYDDQFITRIDKGLRDVTEKSYVANCMRKPDGEPFLFQYEEYGGYFQYPTNRTLKFPAFWMQQFYNMYDTRQPTIRTIQ